MADHGRHQPGGYGGPRPGDFGGCTYRPMGQMPSGPEHAGGSGCCGCAIPAMILVILIASLILF